MRHFLCSHWTIYSTECCIWRINKLFYKTSWVKLIRPRLVPESMAKAIFIFLNFTVKLNKLITAKVGIKLNGDALHCNYTAFELHLHCNYTAYNILQLRWTASWLARYDVSQHIFSSAYSLYIHSNCYWYCLVYLKSQ